MAEEHAFINRLVSPGFKSRVYGWGRIVMEMDRVTGRSCPASEDSLRRVLGSSTEIRLLAGSDLPHVMAPLQSLQVQAIQALAAWGPKHRAVIEEFAENTESETLELIARSCLKRRRGAKRP